MRTFVFLCKLDLIFYQTRPIYLFRMWCTHSGTDAQTYHYLNNLSEQWRTVLLWTVYLASWEVVGRRACIANKNTVVVAGSGSKDAYRPDRSERQTSRSQNSVDLMHLWPAFICRDDDVRTTPPQNTHSPQITKQADRVEPNNGAIAWCRLLPLFPCTQRYVKLNKPRLQASFVVCK